MNVIVKLKKIRNNNESDSLVANYIIRNINKMDTIDIRNLAKEINYSASGVTRFMRKLGYNSFAEFKYDVRNYKSIYGSDKKVDNNLTKIIEKEIQYINEILHNNNLIWTKDESIYKIVNKINSSEIIFIYAQGGTFAVGYDFCLKLQRLGFNVIVSSDSVIQETLLSANEGKDKILFIIFSLSGETQQLVELAKKIKKKNKFLLSFTGFEDNTIKNISNLNLSIFNNDSHFKSLIRGNRISFLFLIDIIIQLLINENKSERSKSILITTR